MKAFYVLKYNGLSRYMMCPMDVSGQCQAISSLFCVDVEGKLNLKVPAYLLYAFLPAKTSQDRKEEKSHREAVNLCNLFKPKYRAASKSIDGDMSNLPR